MLGNLSHNAVLCSFFYDSKQDDSTKSAHSKHIIELFQNRKLCFMDLSAIWENKFGCDEHYICSTVLYLL